MLTVVVKSVVYVYFLMQKAKCITYSELTLAIFADLSFFKDNSNMKLHFKTGFRLGFFKLKCNFKTSCLYSNWKKYSWKFSPINTRFGSQINILLQVEEQPVLMSWSLTNTKPDSLYKGCVSLHPCLQVLLNPTNIATLQDTVWKTQTNQLWVHALDQIRLFCSISEHKLHQLLRGNYRVVRGIQC